MGQPEQLEQLGQRFDVFIPLEKGAARQDPATGDWTVDGPLSSERSDLQGDVAVESALWKGLETWKRLGCKVDYDHKSVKDPNPKWLIGEGVDIRKGPAKGGGTTAWVKTRLYRDKELAQESMKHLLAGGELGYSIGGIVTKRNGKRIEGMAITHVAITPYPVNPDAVIGLAELAKSLTADTSETPETPEPEALEFPDVVSDVVSDGYRALEKAMVASGQAAGFGSDGFRAAVNEDLEGRPKTDRSKGKDGADSAQDTEDEEDGMELDDLTKGQLAALEQDEKVGPLAKAVGALLTGVGRLMKGAAPAKGASPTQDAAEQAVDRADEDYPVTPANAAQNNAPAPDGPTPDVPGAAPAPGEPPAQAAPAGDEDEEGEGEDNTDEEDEGMEKAIPVELEEVLKSIQATVRETVQEELAAVKEDLQKSFASAPALPEGVAEGINKLNDALEAMGMAPKGNAGGTAPAAQTYEVVQKGGQASLTREQVLDKLEGAVLQKGLDARDLVLFETKGVLTDEAKAAIAD